MRYLLAWLLVITVAVVAWRSARPAEPPRCEDEILVWCKSYPGPSDLDCDKMAKEECSHAPPSRVELCKLRAKRLCAAAREGEERETCMSARLLECKPAAEQ